MNFRESDILHKLDQAFNGIPFDDYPEGNLKDIKYTFFLDLEHGYCYTAGSKIHLYADARRWAIVFEKCGYQNRASAATIELTYIGNCVNYPIDIYPERSYISNVNSITLIEAEEYERIDNGECIDYESFELISPTINNITVHGTVVPLEHDLSKYLALGIHPKEYDNPQNLIGYEDIVRFLSATNNELISATESEIRQHIPSDIPKMTTIDQFHFVSYYDKENPPSTQETYQLIAKVLVTQDASFWQPKNEPNNHWSNWESGNL